MKTMVIYDSVHGNTGQIAQAIGEGLGETAGTPEDVELCQIGETRPEQLVGLDLLVVGSPTHGFRPTPATRDFLKSIPKDALKGVRIAAFDTRFTEEEIDSQVFILGMLVSVFGYAAEPISNELQKKGGGVAMAPEGFYVDGTEGPLMEGELERAADWGRQILAKGLLLETNFTFVRAIPGLGTNHEICRS